MEIYCRETTEMLTFLKAPRSFAYTLISKLVEVAVNSMKIFNRYVYDTILIQFRNILIRKLRLCVVQFDCFRQLTLINNRIPSNIADGG